MENEIVEKKTRSLRSLVAIFAGGNVISMLLRMVGGVLTARFVLPGELGLFNGIGLVLGYLPFLQLGILNGLGRELPYNIGMGQRDKAEEIAAAAQAWSLIVGGGTAFCLLLIAGWQGLNSEWELAAGWATFSVGAFFLFYAQNYLQVTYRTSGDFARLAFVNVMSSLTGLVLVSLVWLYGFYGLCLKTIGVSLISFLLLWRWRPISIGPQWNKKHIHQLFKVGLPIFGVGQLYAWWLVLNSTLVLHYMGAEGLGLFQISILTLTTIEMLPKSLGQISYPKMVSDFGKNNSLSRLIKMIILPITWLIAVMVPIVFIGWWLLPHFIEIVLPNYIAGVSAAQWSLVAGFLISFSPMNNIFNVVKQQRTYGIAIVIGIFSYLLGLCLLFLSSGPYLEAFPQALIAGRAAFLTTSYVFLFRLKKNGHPNFEPQS